MDEKRKIQLENPAVLIGRLRETLSHMDPGDPRRPYILAEIKFLQTAGPAIEELAKSHPIYEMKGAKPAGTSLVDGDQFKAAVETEKLFEKLGVGKKW